MLEQEELWWGPRPNSGGLVGQPETPRIGGGQGNLDYGAWWVPTGTDGSLGGVWHWMECLQQETYAGYQQPPRKGTE